MKHIIWPTQTSEKTKAQQKMVKESLTRAFDELHSGKVHHDALTILMSLREEQRHFANYDKSDMENVSDAYLRSLVKQIEASK